ncbi:MAG: hypothetical protein PG980_000451 [Wolbachia endosymbiont of Ctenocephalides felis wCfeJ]|nr:MAG: hypothetical protein PG980_000451 [Wolbachia endosymbiont of Ctenocephalides felis wCfeJ]
MTLKDRTIGGGDQQININASVYCEELKGSFSEEIEQGRTLKFDKKVQVQDIPLIGKKGRTKLFKAENEKRRNTCAVANMNAENRVNIQHDPGVVQSNCQNLSGDEDWVVVNGEDQPNQSPSTTTTLEFQLTQSLLSQVRVNEDNRNANSGRQAQLDLSRMNFIINGKTIDKKCILELYDKNNHLIQNGNEDYRPFAKQVFTGMFEYVKAEIPNDHILEELITNCNQAGYEFTMYGQIQPILVQYNLAPTIPEKTISICCSSVDSASVEYSDVIVVKNPDLDQFEQYESSSKLEFTLKFQNGEVEYENGKVTLNIPEQLKNYKADGKSLLDNVKEHFTDADNAVVESLIANIGDGPKSFIIDLPTEVASSVDNSFDIIPENVVFDLGDMAKLVEEAVDNKDVNALNTYIEVVQAGITHVSPREGLLIVEKVLEIVSQFVKEQGEAWSTYYAMPVVREVYAAKKYAEGYISQEDYGRVKELEKVLRRTKSILSNNENGKNNDQSSSQKNPKPKSIDNQQQQKNVVDKRKNIMYKGEASKQEPIGSNREGGKKVNGSYGSRLPNTQEQQKVPEAPILKQTGITQSEGASSSMQGPQNKSTTVPPVGNDKEKQIPIQSTESKGNENQELAPDQPTEQTMLQMGDAELKSKGDQQDSPSSKSSVGGSNGSASSFVKLPESDTENSNGEYVKVSPLPVSGSGSSLENIDNEDDNKNPQPAPVPLTPAPGPTPVPLVPKELAPVLPEPIPLVPESTPVPPEPGPEPTSVPPAPMPAPPMSSLSNEDDVQSNSRQPCTTGKNDPAPQGTKASKRPVVAASALAIAGIALGVAIAVYLQMLAAGIVVGACCLVAATVIYYCASKSSVENSKVEERCKDKTSKGIVIGS